MSIVEYDEFRAKMEEIKLTCNFLPDVTTTEGYDQSKRVSLDVGKVLTSLEKTRKDKKADSLAYGRSIDGEAKAIREELEAFRLPHKEAYKELDNLKKEREANRKAELERRVAELVGLPELLRDSDSDSVKAALEDIQKEDCLDFYEYTDQALKARNNSQTELSEMFAAKLKQEQEAVELAKLRKAQEERDQKERDERIAKEAEDRANKLAEEKAELERQRAAKDLAAMEKEVRDERERVEKEKAAIEEKRLAALQETKDAELKLVEQKKQAKIDQQKAIDDERERVAEEERKAKAIEEKRAANKRHQGKINSQAVAALIEHAGLDEKQAKNIVKAIARKLIDNVTINY